MFCADYLAAFAFHWGINHQMGQTENKHFKLFAKYPFLHGAVSGFFGALAIYPMDFVRHEIMKSRNILYNMSTVPYATVFFGLYFSMRDKNSIKSQMSWATLSAALAVLAEAPFDRAKSQMMGGSTRTLILANALFIPFGGLLLVMYDKSLSKLYTKS